MRFNRWTKVWIIVTLCALLAYDLYWMNSLFGLLGRIFSLPINSILVRYSGLFIDYLPTTAGAILRFSAVMLGLAALFLLWGAKSKSFIDVKKYVAVALFFEALYFLTTLPINIMEISQGRSPFLLFLGFVLQVILVFPLLTILSYKTWIYKPSAKPQLIKWAMVATVGYLIGIWFNVLFKWLGMAETAGLGFILTGITSLGFVNSAITLTLSVAVAVASFVVIAQGKNRALGLKLLALASVLLGLHFAIFILYSAIAPGAWKFVLLTEIWPVALTGLGASMFFLKSDGLAKQEQPK